MCTTGAEIYVTSESEVAAPEALLATTSAIGFRQVDQAVVPSTLIGYLDTASTLVAVRAYTEQSFNLLGASEGAYLLDIGCGTGADACLLAKWVGRYGRVIGIDCSKAMVAEARLRAEALCLSVEFRLGDAHNLDFQDGAVDGCRASRVLQHVMAPARALKEMVRVTRPGGRVVVAEPDWGTLIIDAADRNTTQRIIEMRSSAMRHAWIGRQLPRMFRDAGLLDLQVMPFTAVIPTLAIAVQLYDLRAFAERGRELGLVSADEIDRWRGDLETADQNGHFFATLTGFLVAGSKAGGPV